MRFLTMMLLLTVVACKNNPSNSEPSSSDAGASTSTDTTKTKSTAYAYTFTDTVLVSLGAIDFAAVTKSKPNMPIIDVRSAEEYKRGHIWRSVNIEYNDKDFYPRIASFGRNQEYAVYCMNGEVSFGVAEQMKKMGFLRIYHLQKGLFHWGDTGQALQLK